MDKIFIKERINILDYKNNNQELVFSSQQDVTGGLVNIQLESDTAGWHQLTFDIPAQITDGDKLVPNPLMKHLFPLARLQYTRIIKVNDEEEELILRFVIQPEVGQRDDNGIVIYSYTGIDHPRHYLSKAKNGITIGEGTLDPIRSLTPANEVTNIPGRVVYIKAEPQVLPSVMQEADLLRQSDALPGAFIYVESTDAYYRLIAPDFDAVVSGTESTANPIPRSWLKLSENESYQTVTDEFGETKIVPDAVWNPEWMGYPLAPDVNQYNYGTLNPNIVQFYWDLWFYDPAKTMGRFEGVMYRTGERLLYDVYQTIDYETPEKFLGQILKIDNLKYQENPFEEGALIYVLETGTVWQYIGGQWQDTFQSRREAFDAKNILTGTWQKLNRVTPLLTPNNAKNYMEYILEGTDWSVGTVDTVLIPDGTIEVDAESSIAEPVLVEKRMSISFENSNAYNALGEIAQSFEMYLRFDHVNKTVDLKSVPGEDNGLLFQWRDNLKNAQVTRDGEKTVSKLWVYGGEDLTGEVGIAEYSRIEPSKYKGAFTSLTELENVYSDTTQLDAEDYAKITTQYTWAELVSETYNDGRRLPIVNTLLAGELTPTSWGTGEIPVVQSLSDLPSSGSLGQAIFVIDMDSIWAWIPLGNAWYDTFMSLEPSDTSILINMETLVTWDNNTWNIKGQFYEYYEPISPYGDNYILDFSYFVDRELLTNEEVDDIKYNYVLPISRLNRKKWPLQTELINFTTELLRRNAQYDAAKIARDAVDKSLRTSYAIYDTTNSPNTLIELEINAYPPGATYGIQGWTPVPIPYSTSTSEIYATFAALLAAHPSGTIGQTFRVADEIQVYMWMAPYAYNDTITSYLNWNQGTVDGWGNPDTGRRDLLFTADGSREARVRTVGLFQKYRDEELWGKDLNNRWYNPPASPNMLPNEGIGDARLSDTSTGQSYYNALWRKVENQMEMDDCLDRIANLQISITDREQKIELLQQQITNLEHSLRQQYGDFIVEGVYDNDDMVWANNLWLEGMKALKLYHYPLVTYDLGVVDVSGLPEYRTMTDEIYHDIVYRLNKPELVLPNPGDYVYITDNTLGITRVSANITSITRNLSNPSQHTLTISTVDNNTEELVGRLVTAANTIFDKQMIYNRSAIIKTDGTIATDSVKGTVDDPDAGITVLGKNGTVRLEGNGIVTVDQADPYQRMQYTGKGIYASTNGGKTWDNIISAGKIQIKSLSAGNIDSNSISVSSINRSGAVIINGDGIAGYNYSITNPENQRTFFINARNGDAYFRGEISAGSGLIGGWTISTSALSSGSGSNFTAMSSTSSDYRFIAGGTSYASAGFAVKANGSMKATNATIIGNITAESGKIAGYTISGQQLVGSNVGMSGLSGHGYAFWAGSNDSSAAPFRVGHDGSLRATNATITGSITGSTITGSNITGNTISGGSLSIGGRFSVDYTGFLSASAASITGNLYTSGWEITGNYITSRVGSTTIRATGFCGFYGNHRIVGDSSITINSQMGVGAIFGDGMINPTNGVVTIYASSSSYLHLNSPTNGVRINGPISVSTGAGARTNTYTGTPYYTYNGRTYRFIVVNGFICGSEQV